VFICIALHEADDQPGASLSTIERETGYTRKTVIDALRFLNADEHRFIDLCGRESDGTHRYRPAAYAWFGSDKQQRSSIPQIERSKAASSLRPGGIIPPLEKTFPHDDDVQVLESGLEEKHHHHAVERARKIFAEAGFDGVNLGWLAENIAPGLAVLWAKWVKIAPREIYRNPHGYCWVMLKANPNAEPPPLPDSKPERKPLVRADFTDAQWERISEDNRQRILEGAMF